MGEETNTLADLLSTNMTPVLTWIISSLTSLVTWITSTNLVMAVAAIFFVGAVVGMFMRIYHSIL